VAHALELPHEPPTGIGLQLGAAVGDCVGDVGAAVGVADGAAVETSGAHRNRTFQSLQPPWLSLLRHRSPLALHVMFVSNGSANGAFRRHSAWSLSVLAGQRMNCVPVLESPTKSLYRS